MDVGTTANKIVQLDGTGKLPAIDGSQLTNLPVSTVGDGTITGGNVGVGVKIAAGTITNANISTTANIAATKLANTVVLDTEAPNAAGDISGDFSTGLQIKSNTIASAEIADASISAADLAGNINISTTGNITGSDFTATGNIGSSGTISGNGSGLTALNASNVSSGTLALGRIAVGSNGDVLTTVSGTPTWQAPVTGVTALDALTDATVVSPSSGQLLVNDGAGQFKNVSMSGDAAISNTGVLTINNGAISGGVGGKITDASITSADLANG